MLLRELNQKQRNLFLDLSIHMANADGCFSDDEKVMVQQLCDEMGMEVRYESETSVNAALSELVETSTEREKRIIVLELAGLIMADNIFAEEEKDLLEKVSTSFEIDKESSNKLPEIMRELFATYEKISLFLSKADNSEVI